MNQTTKPTKQNQTKSLGRQALCQLLLGLLLFATGFGMGVAAGRASAIYMMELDAVTASSSQAAPASLMK